MQKTNKLIYKEFQKPNNDKLIKRAYMVMFAKTLLRNGSIDNSTFNTIMLKIEKTTS